MKRLVSGERPLTVRETLDDVWTRLSSIDVLSDRPAVSRLAQEAMTLIVAVRTAQELSKLDPEPGEGLRAYRERRTATDPFPAPTLAELDRILRESLPSDVVFAIRPTGDPFTGWARKILVAAPAPTAERLDYTCGCDDHACPERHPARARLADETGSER